MSNSTRRQSRNQFKKAVAHLRQACQSKPITTDAIQAALEAAGLSVPAEHDNPIVRCVFIAACCPGRDPRVTTIPRQRGIDFIQQLQSAA